MQRHHPSRLRAPWVSLGFKLALLFTPIAAQSAILLEQGFPNTGVWPLRYSYKWGAGSAAVSVPYPAVGAYGTIDTYGSSTPSSGLRLSVNSSGATGYWEAAVVSGLLPSSSAGIAAGELTPGKVSISFDCWANYSRPIVVLIESFTTNNSSSVNGRSEATIYPAAANFYQRKVLELSDLTTVGANGAFKPDAPYYQITFRIDSQRGRGWPAASAIEARFDNINISNPKFYVDSVNGRDWYYNNASYPDGGISEARPFQTIQSAIGAANAGDIILVRERATRYRNWDFFVSGTSNINYNSSSAVGSFNVKGGAPSKWTVLKNYPGETPIIESSGFQCISIGNTNSSTADTSYIEIRGLELVGVAQQLDLADPGANDTANTIKGTGKGGANTAGVAVRGSSMAKKPHHIRIADNLVHDLSGAGIATQVADWISIENNIVYNTSWWTNSATSGISNLTPYDFSGTTGDYRMLISGNEVYDNECRKRWIEGNVYSDGNGIIIDKHRNAAGTNDVDFPAYRGRTLISNNICYRNGGSGIHAYVSDHVDIVHNSTYSNSRRSDYQGGYGEIFAAQANDILVYNNLMVADSGKPLNECRYSTDVNPANRRSPRTSGVTFRNNVYKFNDTDVNGSSPGGVTLLYPVTNNTPVAIRYVANGYQQWQEDYDRQKETGRLNQNADAALAENNLRTYTTVWANAGGGDFNLVAGSGARQRGTLVVGNSNSAELSFLPSLDINFSPRVQGVLSAPGTLLPDAGAIESPATY